jgi:hypothetical protein
MAFAVLIGFSVAALAVAVRESEASLRAPAWLFAVVPPLAFGVQEHLERALQGEPTAGAALEPTFVLGLVLQVPFALLAYLLARLLLGAVALAARLVAATPRLARPRSPSLAVRARAAARLDPRARLLEPRASVAPGLSPPARRARASRPDRRSTIRTRTVIAAAVAAVAVRQSAASAHAVLLGTTPSNDTVRPEAAGARDPALQ